MRELGSKTFLVPIPNTLSPYQRDYTSQKPVRLYRPASDTKDLTSLWGVSLWGPNTHPSSNHFGHLTLLQASQSPRASQPLALSLTEGASGLGRARPTQAGREVTAGPRGYATLPGARPPPQLTPCRWKPSPPAGCSVLAPSPMAALSLGCVAWSRGARPRPPGCHSS